MSEWSQARIIFNGLAAAGCRVSQGQDILEIIEGHATLAVVLQRSVSKPGAIAPILSVRIGTKSFQAFLLQLSFFTQEGQQESIRQCLHTYLQISNVDNQQREGSLCKTASTSR